MQTLPHKTPPHKPQRRAALPGAPERKAAAPGRETRSFVLQVKAVNEDGTIEGYGSVFGVPDSYDDIVARGAFAKSLVDHKAAGTMPAMLWQHEADEPIGVWTDMVEDARGLLVKGRLALEVSKGKEAHALLKMGALTGLSIGFVSKEWSYDADTDIRTLTAVDLWEVSLVTFPANAQSRITNVKSADELSAPKDAERILRDAGFSKADATAFVSRVMRMGEARSDSADSTAKALKSAQRLLATLSKP